LGKASVGKFKTLKSCHAWRRACRRGLAPSLEWFDLTGFFTLGKSFTADVTGNLVVAVHGAPFT
jgi:hypothetical protein